MKIANLRTSLLAHLVIALTIIAFLTPSAFANTKYKKVRQYIAALASPTENSGTGAQTWGIWKIDPGVNGVSLGLFDILKQAGGYAPGNWKFDDNDWWLEEHGLIMESPEFPLAAGKYLVTGEREVTTTLTVYPADAKGDQRWELANDAEIFDVTHMPCRSARYTPANGKNICTPAKVVKTSFPVDPGAIMPAVTGCEKQDYAVLIVIGVETK